MSSIVIPVEQKDLALYKQMLEECPDLVDVVKEQLQKAPHPTLITLDAGVGNSINYYYLGQEWQRRQQWEQQKGGAAT